MFRRSLGNWRRIKEKVMSEIDKQREDDQKRWLKGHPPTVTAEKIDHWFSYHPPVNESQKEAYGAIREAGKQMAMVVLSHTPGCADQTAAIRKIREAVMVANAAVACEGK